MAKATDRAVITRALDFCLAEIQPCKSHPWGFASVHNLPNVFEMNHIPSSPFS